ncbi:MAG: PASTA domain-containing protein [Fibrobacter sp.]|jgi:beta-lactam-binding protein with PASTA domain|nr:PASTA domain-containing protein [Fibrobacter sp.]
MKKNYTISISSSRLWKIYLPGLLFVSMLGVLFGFFLVDRVIMPNIVGVDRDIVEVPSVTGLGLEEAREKFFRVGLLTEIRSREYDSNIPLESVISQFPESGSKVKKGRRISVTVSKGKEIAIIPDVRNLSERQARIELKKHGFTLGKVKKVYSDDKPVDVVVNAFPESGTTISREMEVDLIVSKGARPTHAEVPNLVGESLSTAKKKMEECGLTIGKLSYKNNSSLLPGTIISQSESPGSSIPLESSVDLVVSVIR